jgi:fructose-specific component phosphotransferase system IIB-like protein
VVGENELAPQAPVKDGALVGRRVIVGQRALAARQPVVFAELGDAFDGIDPASAAASASTLISVA